MISSAADQVGCFEPIHAAHAIDQVAFIVQFDKPLDEVSFGQIESATEGLREDFPGKKEFQAMGISLQNGNIPMAQPTMTSGILLRKVAPDGSVEIELRAERASLTFITTRYTRWAGVIAQVKKYFDLLLPHYWKADIGLRSIGLNYIDKFTWSGALEDFSLKKLIKPETKYIAPHVFEANDLWHCHSGAFSRENNFAKRLLNVNIDCIDTNQQKSPKRIVSITSVVTDHFNQPGFDTYPLGENSLLDDVYSGMQSMHDYGKLILNDIVTPEISKRIALQG